LKAKQTVKLLPSKGVEGNNGTGVSCCLQVRVTSLCSYERPTLVPVFANQKKYEGNFHFYKKKKKAKSEKSVWLLFCRGPL